MTDYEAVIGIEVHAQLLTRSKMFCGCEADIFGAEPNSRVCPVCLGLPGALPTINRRAVEQALQVGLALNCEIAHAAVFARKNYFYPDLPKGYQISMYERPLARHGWIEIDGESTRPTTGSGMPEAVARRIGIQRVHLEEDTAKSTHAGDQSLVDFNRAGLPLLEIVSEPELRTPEEARQYLVKLRAVLRYLGVSSGDMEKGAMRCEANVSLRPRGTSGLGAKVEVKNLNSFRSVKLALVYEIERQTRLLANGQPVQQVTMGWDEQQGQTFEQRIKEGSDDYRYFPEPDLPPLRISRVWVAEIRETLPELPYARQARFVGEYGLSGADAAVLTADRDVADYFETAVAAGRKAGISPKTIGNWVSGELFRLIKEAGASISQVVITPAMLVGVIALVEKRTITAGSGKAVLEEMYRTGQPAEEIVEQGGLAQILDRKALARVVADVVAAHPQQAAEYRAGKETLLHWFVGQVMRATGGQANPHVVQDLLRGELAN
jgi:aspartyl-tRNA(Asn)/glutamyl-tRNA(Gln) amidotransferase subunit B